MTMPLPVPICCGVRAWIGSPENTEAGITSAQKEKTSASVAQAGGEGIRQHPDLAQRGERSPADDKRTARHTVREQPPAGEVTWGIDQNVGRRRERGCSGRQAMLVDGGKSAARS